MTELGFVLMTLMSLRRVVLQLYSTPIFSGSHLNLAFVNWRVPACTRSSPPCRGTH